jgi:hypothetical protein
MGQTIESIAFVHPKAKRLEIGDKRSVARIEIMDGTFVVSFANTIENLIF